MIPNGEKMDWNGHHLVFDIPCRGCFFADKDSCPDCDEGLWVEEKPSPWHTGTPTEDIQDNDWYTGWYTFAYKCHGEVRYITIKEPSLWYFTNCDTLAWQKIEPYKEKA